MKRLKLISALSLFSFLLLACTQENEGVVDTLDLTAQIGISLKDQVPQALFDTTAEGIYHGIIASGTSQSRGKVWINVGNDTQYNALIEMVGGATYKFALQSNNVSEASPSIYQYKGEAGSFTLDVTNPRTPIITDAKLNSLPYLSSVVKSRNQNRAMAKTGTFTETGNPALSGTWNLLSEGAPVNAPEYTGISISSSAITFNGTMYNDTDFAPFDSTLCWLDPNMIPVLNLQGHPDYLSTEDQVSTIGSYSVSWSLSYQIGFYQDYQNCVGRASGIFTAVSGTTTRIGEIYID